MLKGSDSDRPRIVSEEGIEGTNTSIFEDDQIGTNEFVFNELLNLELRKLSEWVSTLETQELHDLLKMSSSQPWTSRLYSIQQMLVEYLAEISPGDSLASIEHMSINRRHALLPIIFANWSRVDLEQALTAVTKLSHDDQRVATGSILAARFDLSSEELSSLANNFEFLPDLVNWEQELRVYEILEQEPIRAIELLAGDEIDDGQQIDLYRLVAEQLYQNIGMNTILQLEDARLGVGVLDELFEQVTTRDREAALALFSTMEDRRREFWGWKLLKNWVAEDEEGAFQAIDNLPISSFRQSMWSDFASNWGRKNPNAVLDRLMEIPRSVRRDALYSAAGELATDHPGDVLDRLSTMRTVPGASVDSAVERVMRTWSSDAPKQALDWVQRNTKEETKVRTRLLREVLPQFALVEPKQAMNIAVDEFNSEDAYLSLQHYVLSSLVFADKFDVAIELLAQVRPEVKLTEHKEVGSELLRHDRLDDTLSLADSLTNEERIDYFKSVASSAVIFGHTSDALNMIARLPTTDLQRVVAEKLLSREFYTQAFTTQQLDTLKAFVSE